jgi:LruC domain-containing protein
LHFLLHNFIIFGIRIYPVRTGPLPNKGTLMTTTRFCCSLLFVVATVLSAGTLKGATTYFPGQGEHGTVLFEDQWPSHGDGDFNDVVVRYNYEMEIDAGGSLEQLTLKLQPAAVGSLLSNGLALRLPIPSSTPMNGTLSIGHTVMPVFPQPGESKMVVQLFQDVRDSFIDGAAGFINTVPGEPYIEPLPVELHLTFPGPVTLPPEKPFDLFIFRTGDPGHQIHRPHYYGTDSVNASLYGTGDDASDPPPALGGSRWYVNVDGIPWVLNIGEDVTHPDHAGLTTWPKENVPIDVAYPDIVDFFASEGTLATDWYLNPNVSALYAQIPEPASWLLGAAALYALVSNLRNRRSVGDH